MGIFSITKHEHSGENAGNIIWFHARYSAALGGFLSDLHILYFMFCCCWNSSSGWFPYVTQNHSESCDRVMSFLSVTGSFTYLRFHNLMSLRSKGATSFFTTYLTTLTGTPPHGLHCSNFSGSMQGHWRERAPDAMSLRRVKEETWWKHSSGWGTGSLLLYMYWKLKNQILASFLWWALKSHRARACYISLLYTHQSGTMGIKLCVLC